MNVRCKGRSGGEAVRRGIGQLEKRIRLVVKGKCGVVGVRVGAELKWQGWDGSKNW